MELYFWLSLLIVPGIGPVLRKRLIEAFHSPQRVFEATEKELLSVEGMNHKTVKALKGIDPFKTGKELLQKVKATGSDLITLFDPRYPSNLRQIPDPPLVLFYKGSLQEEDSRSIAIVGSRKATPYGREFAKNLAFQLAQAGLTIVSGLARGIDTEAHVGALEAGGRTFGVLGSGIDRIYPPENEELARRIIQRGAILSEFLPGTPPEKWNFPQRNRIISGLTLGVVVVEASEKSGALITASLALEQGRSVFAVPGMPGSWAARGTNRLIKEGANLVEGPEDILEEILPQVPALKRKEERPKSPLEKLILEFLQEGPKHVDEISRFLKKSPQETLGLLLKMELEGLVRELPGKVFLIAG
jgi:DNA processing protein